MGIISKEVTVRDIEETDLPALVAIKGAGSEALHRDRLRDAQDGCMRYLAAQDGEEVVGFACLVFRRPAYWSDAEDTTRLPMIVDLRVREDRRGQGYGTALVRAMEALAANAGYARLYLSVEPRDNPRATALYLRLGYRPLQDEPYHSGWDFTDSQGNRHRGEAWVVDMVKAL